ncbi:MAG: CFI-box-CTERM domain-containing protein [Pseudobdellovibrionaceae bacterium]
MEAKTCPRCKQPTTDLFPVDVGLREKLVLAGFTESLPERICANCFSKVNSTIGKNSVLLNQARMKDAKRQQLWTQRMTLIKKGRQAMEKKKYNEAAVSYEKYVRSMEVVFDCKPGELTPEKFKENARHQELTVIAGAYWDLLRIYDTSPEFVVKQDNVAKLLARFLRFTPIYPDILRKAEQFEKTARNPAAIRKFLDEVSSARPRCFVATSAFESPLAIEVWKLRTFREWILKEKPWGRKFVRFYYRNSPKAAAFLDKYPVLKPPVRALLRLFLFLIGRSI